MRSLLQVGRNANIRYGDVTPVECALLHAPRCEAIKEGAAIGDELCLKPLLRYLSVEGEVEIRVSTEVLSDIIGKHDVEQRIPRPIDRGTHLRKGVFGVGLQLPCIGR